MLVTFTSLTETSGTYLFFFFFFRREDAAVDGHFRSLHGGPFGEEDCGDRGPVRRHQAEPDDGHRASDAAKLRHGVHHIVPKRVQQTKIAKRGYSRRHQGHRSLRPEDDPERLVPAEQPQEQHVQRQERALHHPEPVGRVAEIESERREEGVLRGGGPEEEREQ
jgi:hypothetical protein